VEQLGPKITVKKARSLLKAPIFPYVRQQSIQMRYIREWFSLQQDEILRLSEDTRDNER
jgi:ERCC4-related helicase